MDYDPSIQNDPNGIGETYPAIDPTMAATASSGASMPMTGLAIGAGLGLLSSIGQQNANKARAIAAATQTRFSPWTRMGAGQLPTPQSALAPILGYGASGAALQQGLQNGQMNPYLWGGKLPQPGVTVSNAQ